MQEGRAQNPTTSTRILLITLIAIISVIVLRSAWVCDDAYISFRVADNFVDGHGLTWNAAERVQAFTNALWVLLLSVFHVITGDFYFTSIFLSFALVIAAVYVTAFRISSTLWGAVFALGLLTVSKAFVDYSTSGLENPLIFLLLALFCAVYFKGVAVKRKLLWLTLLTALATVTRPDAILLVAPALTVEMARSKEAGKWKHLLLGLSPLIAWKLFALVFYGSLVPNTYHAKMNTGASLLSMIAQGSLYFIDSLFIDPPTLIGILCVFILVRHRSIAGGNPLLAGIGLYLAYILWIGGDFMSGRFFAAPLVLAAILLSRVSLPAGSAARVVPLVLLLAVGLISDRSPLRTDRLYGGNNEGMIEASGIADERGIYYQATGLMRAGHAYTPEMSLWADQGRGLAINNVAVSLEGNIGFTAFYAGSGVYIIDRLGLGDPLLARLTGRVNDNWRIGHIDRLIPEGYTESLEADQNLLTDPDLVAFYRIIRRITRGPVFSWERLSDVVKLNLGYYDRFVERYEARPKETIGIAELATVRAKGTGCRAPGSVNLVRGGVEVVLDSISHPAAVELSVCDNGLYEIVLRCGSDQLEILRSEDRLFYHDGMRVDALVISAQARDKGISSIIVRPTGGAGTFSLGHIRLLEKAE